MFVVSIPQAVVCLASAVCSLVGEVAPGACVGFLVGETDACPLVGGADSYHPDGWGIVSLDVIRGGSMPLGIGGCL